MRRLALATPALAVPLALGACRYPRDPEGTLDRVEGGTLRVGAVEDPPWVDLAAPSRPGSSRRCAGVRRRGRREVEWVRRSEAGLVVRGFQLDLLVGGLSRSSP